MSGLTVIEGSGGKGKPREIRARWLRLLEAGVRVLERRPGARQELDQALDELRASDVYAIPVTGHAPLDGPDLNPVPGGDR